MIRHIKNKSLFTIILLFGHSLLHAAETTTAVPAGNSQGLNVTLISLVTLVIVLMFTIGMLAYVLIQLTETYRGKMRKARGQSSAIGKTTALFLLFSAIGYQAMAADAVVATTPKTAILIDGIAQFDFYVIVSIIALELIIIVMLLTFIRGMLRLISDRPPVTKEAKVRKRGMAWDRFHQAVAIEKEKDILLDHNYDGIQELDNSLPPWWKYGFYITIIVAFIYIYHYHIAGSGQVSHDEYVAEMQQAEEEKAAYLAKSANNVDENTVKLLTDAADITAGQQIFQSTCAACHAKDGGGGVGPNLTDDYWLHSGGIKDVFKSIKYGWQDKGMKSWKDDFSPKQIAQIASYVKSLHNTKPTAPKDKQGELYIDAGSPGTQPDSTKADKVASK